jgi:signal transduction histidine kinase
MSPGESAGLKALRSGFVRLGGHLLGGALVAYGVLLLALLLTLLASYYVRQNVEMQTRARFEESTQATQQAIERRTKAYLDAMFGARGLFYASDSVTREEWDNYVKGIEPNKRFEGLQALSYAQRVEPAQQRKAFMRRTQEEEGLPELRPDLAPGGERRAYYPITYSGPLNEANQSTLNYDLYADPQHRMTMNQARDTGSPRATRMVYVLTEAPPSHNAHLALRAGFTVYLPIYDEEEEGEELGSVAERRGALKGFVVGSFVSEELLEGLFKGSFNPAIDFEVYDGEDTTASRSPLLYDRDGIKRAGEKEGTDESLFTEESQIEVGGREWSLYFATLADFEEGAESKLPTFVLVSGVVVSLLLFGITWMLVRSRTRAERTSKDLEAANKELETFSYSVSHDLRAPLRSVEGFSQILLEDYADKLDEEGRGYLGRVRAASRRMALLIDDLLNLSRVTRSALRRQTVDLSALAKEIAAEIRKSQPEREVRFMIAEGLKTNGDARLLSVALENLLGNAWKFTQKEDKATIEFGAVAHDGGIAYFVRDDGVGFDMSYAAKLFGAFQRLHNPDEFEGTGIGLATVARIVHRHGGRVWAKGEVGKGATFYFTLGGHRQ